MSDIRTPGGRYALLPQVGEIPRKRHTQFRSPDGGLYAEELMGVEGFSSDSALLYHRHLPTAIVNAEVVTDDRGPLTPNHPLKPRHFRTPGPQAWDLGTRSTRSPAGARCSATPT